MKRPDSVKMVEIYTDKCREKDTDTTPTPTNTHTRFILSFHAIEKAPQKAPH